MRHRFKIPRKQQEASPLPFLALLAFLALMSGANSGPTIENIEREKGNEWRKKRGSNED
jgi:hypothetical protein